MIEVLALFGIIAVIGVFLFLVIAAIVWWRS